MSDILDLDSAYLVGVNVFCGESVQQLSVEEMEKYSDVLFCEDKCRVADDVDIPCVELHNEISCVVQDSVVVSVREKLDSAASANMSGVIGRISNSGVPLTNIRINGFNNAGSMVNSVGVNCDGRKEYFVREMPSNLALLCANDYAHVGAVILLPESGRIIELNELEKSAFLSFIEQFSVYLQLKVENRTYEVCRTSCNESDRVLEIDNMHTESANSGTATRYFNSKVNISNNEERILAALLTGLSFNDLYMMIKFGYVDGLPRDISVQTLNKFEHNYGRNPSVLQMAIPNLTGNTKGYMAQPPKIAKIGERESRPISLWANLMKIPCCLLRKTAIPEDSQQNCFHTVVQLQVMLILMCFLDIYMVNWRNQWPIQLILLKILSVCMIVSSMR